MALTCPHPIEPILKVLEVAPINFPHDLIPEPLRWLHRMSWSHRVSSLHKSNAHIYRSSTMNQRHQAEYSLNLSSRPLLHNPSLNPHLDSLSTPDWLQPLNHSPHPCVAPAVPSRRLFINITFTHPQRELSQHLRKTLRLLCDSSFPESPGLQHPFGALIQLQIPPGHLLQCLHCSPNVRTRKCIKAPHAGRISTSSRPNRSGLALQPPN